jgi:hypothetical protein
VKAVAGGTGRTGVGAGVGFGVGTGVGFGVGTGVGVGVGAVTVRLNVCFVTTPFESQAWITMLCLAADMTRDVSIFAAAIV